MGLKTETRIIDGMEITVQQLPARKGFALMGQLMGIAAPAFQKAEGLSMNDGVAALLPALGAAFEKLTPKKLDDVMAQLFATATVVCDTDNGKRQYELNRPEHIDEAFAGKLKAMFSALKFAAEVNFADFFADALAQAKSTGAEKNSEGSG